jgi:predicted nucleic acid-binding protein
MNTKVVDCSALAAVVFAEPEAREVAPRLDGAILHAPTLLPYELANAARNKTLRRPGEKEAIGSALSAALMLPIFLHAVPAKEVWELALRTNLTTYDASYLWLARHMQADLVTLDKELAAAATPGTTGSS